MTDLPWQKLFGKRCKERLRKGRKHIYFGRCELSPHGPEVAHALERGMINVRWNNIGSWYEQVELAKTVVDQQLTTRFSEAVERAIAGEGDSFVLEGGIDKNHIRRLSDMAAVCQLKDKIEDFVMAEEDLSKGACADCMNKLKKEFDDEDSSQDHS